MDYIIVGDTENYKGCLVYTCGTLENAQKALDRMLTQPNKTDKIMLEQHTNLRIDTVEDKDCWWRQGGLD